MKTLKRILYTALCLCLLLTTALPASAREEEYTYTVRFFAGKQGTFQNGEIMLVEKELHYGDRINFYYNAVNLHDNSKYYIRGIRESGKDNSDSFQTSSFVVTGDMDYVIAYGILGDATSYTINYVDTEGNTLAPSETYYGNVGDRPVVAYIYIEGWTPQAYNMTQTLKKDPAENVFTFVYTRTEQPAAPQPPDPAPAPGEPTPAPEPEPVPPTPQAPENPGIVVIPNDDTPLGGGPGGADADNPDAPGPDGDGLNPVGEDDENIPDDDTPLGRPDEIEDLDEDAVPTSNFLGSDARLLGIPVPVIIVVALAAVGAAWYFLFMRRKKQKDRGEGES